MSYQKMSLCIALGIVLGIFPVLGTTTLLCAIAAIALRLNLPLIQLVNYAVYPMQLILLPLFYGAGNWLFHDHSSRYSGGMIVEMLQSDMWGSLTALWELTLVAILFWVLAGPLLVFSLYGILKPAIRKLTPKQYAPITNVKRHD